MLLYYYQGCKSWTWFYPNHYAPFASDFYLLAPELPELQKHIYEELFSSSASTSNSSSSRGSPPPPSQADSFAWSQPDHSDDCERSLLFSHMRPFHPLEQLMSVFPADSRKFLPFSWQKLMIEEVFFNRVFILTKSTVSSKPTNLMNIIYTLTYVCTLFRIRLLEIVDFYPTELAEDLNGKRFAWQTVVLLPFVDEKRLLEVLETVYDDLTETESTVFYLCMYCTSVHTILCSSNICIHSVLYKTVHTLVFTKDTYVLYCRFKHGNV